MYEAEVKMKAFITEERGCFSFHQMTIITAPSGFHTLPNCYSSGPAATRQINFKFPPTVRRFNMFTTHILQP